MPDWVKWLLNNDNFNGWMPTDLNKELLSQQMFLVDKYIEYDQKIWREFNPDRCNESVARLKQKPLSQTEIKQLKEPWVD